MEGERFGKYVLLDRLAIGGMAEIFRAKTFGAAGFEKVMVIKRILPAFSDDDQFVKMFIDEATLVARLQHANIVQIYDFDKVDGSYYLAMELVEGKDLRKITREAEKLRRPMRVELALYLIGETLKGLHYAHSRQIDGRPLEVVHRDLSPHNLLVSYEGEVKISDFGIAKARERLAQTVAGIVKGKVGYMSPEQAMGAPLDRRSDLFSVGLILYELATGQRAYPHQAEHEMLQKVRRGEIVPARRHAPDLPADVEQFMTRLLAPNPDFRFGSAGDALRELSGVQGYAFQSIALGHYVRGLFEEEAQRAQAGDRSGGRPTSEEAGAAQEPGARSGGASPGAAGRRGEAEPARAGDTAREPRWPAEGAGMDLGPLADVVLGGPSARAALVASGSLDVPSSPPRPDPGATGGTSPSAGSQQSVRSQPSGWSQPSVRSGSSGRSIPSGPIAATPWAPAAPPPWAKWVLGPLVAAAIASATAAVAARVFPGASFEEAADAGAREEEVAPRRATGPQIVQLLPPRRPARGRLRIITVPPGARILIDGQDVGTPAPAIVESEPGRRARLRIERAGFQPREQPVVFETVERELRFELVPRPR